MTRAKRTSAPLELAEKRLLGLKSIDPVLDMGDGLSVVGLQTAHDALKSNLDKYNMLLTQADEKLNEIVKGERGLGELCDRLLSGVGAKFGKDSNQYEKAGGTRKSERKKPQKKEKKV
jgi:hypothetical protein